MGAENFTTNPIAGATADEAFTAAKEQALYEWGHNGYTGTIAEKHDFEVVQETPLTEQAAYDLADSMLRDEQYTDKWGPAGAVPVAAATRTVTVNVDALTLPHTGEKDALRDAAQAEARKKRLIRRGETVEDAMLVLYTDAPPTTVRRASRTITQATVSVTLRKSKPHLTRQTSADAWVFFGCASS